MPRLVINPATGELDEVDTGGSGSTGPPGQPGATGEQGEDGADGLPGPKGDTGATGATGATGSQGAQGIPGNDGQDGEDGLPGQDGDPGVPGPVGTQGLPGFDGVDGEDSWEPGPIGATGLIGPTGLAGSIGMSGMDGEDGQDSIVPGSRGIAGAIGPPGIPGNDGENGEDGFVITPTGAVTGTGVANQVAFWSSPVSLTGNTGLVWNVSGSSILKLETPGSIRVSSISDLTVDLLPQWGINGGSALFTGSSQFAFCWSSTTSFNVGTPDIGLARSAIGLLAVTDGATGTGNLTANQLTSTVAIGTSPLVVTSTDRVVNLNADLIDGLHADAFARRGEFMTGTMMDGLEEREMPLRFGNFINEESVGRSLYLLLAGRTGTTNNPIISTDSAGLITGSHTTANNLGLQPNDIDQTGTIKLWPNFATPANNVTTTLMTWNPTFSTPTGAGVNASILYGLNFSPTITDTGNTGTVQVNTFNFIRADGTYTTNVASTVSTALLMNDAMTYTVSANVAMCTPTSFGASKILQVSTANTTTCASANGFMASTTFRTQTNASANLTVTEYNAFRVAPTFTCTLGTLALGTFVGLAVNVPTFNVGGTALTVTNYIGIDIGDLTVGASGIRTVTNTYGIRSAMASGTNKLFINHTGTAACAFGGKFTTYNNTVTKGFGVPTIVAAARSTAQTAAVASVATFTAPASDGTYRVSGNVLVTASTAHSFAVQCTYTDESNVARTLVLPVAALAGTFVTSGLITTAGPFESPAMHIRVKASTAITILTAGTFTSVTYNVDGLIEQLA